MTPSSDNCVSFSHHWVGKSYKVSYIRRNVLNLMIKQLLFLNGTLKPVGIKGTILPILDPLIFVPFSEHYASNSQYNRERFYDRHSFLTHQVVRGVSGKSLLTYTSVISYVHKLSNIPDPTNSVVIRKLLIGARKLDPSTDLRLPINLVSFTDSFKLENLPQLPVII